jgi:hypothetical protein
MCPGCLVSSVRIIEKVTARLRSAEDLVLETREKCVQCVGTNERSMVDACVNEACVTTTRRIEIAHACERLQHQASRLGVDPRCLDW